MSGEVSLFGSTNQSSLVPSHSISRGVTRQIKKHTDLVLGRGEVALTTDTVRAGLTYSALNNVGTLVSAAKSLMDVAPEGAAYYEQIIGAYTIGAASAIARFS
ncbi:phosphoenolpyruvate carboxylase [Leekyejoonella antrihumi]|uniref:Phosphoenolpyruvate carboxylase n=1 Tax=Leekyejoonella antrihumi TaxID=1660198 RepID=A0A563DVV9_9MICO|nr:phosphoenolpyruvate carboxylase [Leekyejoonella antrihumi]TWP34347.1 phosphoenolpyruvate carboxylase [Leekyejoonella antrihumi]